MLICCIIDLEKKNTVCFVSVTKKLDIVKHETFYAIASHIFNTFVKQDIIKKEESTEIFLYLLFVL